MAHNMTMWEFLWYTSIEPAIIINGILVAGIYVVGKIKKLGKVS